MAKAPVEIERPWRLDVYRDRIDITGVTLTSKEDCIRLINTVANFAAEHFACAIDRITLADDPLLLTDQRGDEAEVDTD